eukprot:GHVQ01031723.1.p1 GENE.GHVQ01031723.1~~GHVQ01031723.1.p1  ORF type:complete len:221 (-),score=21.44 GHVQ01031723.1:103-765(-)
MSSAYDSFYDAAQHLEKLLIREEGFREIKGGVKSLYSSDCSGQLYDAAGAIYDKKCEGVALLVGSTSNMIMWPPTDTDGPGGCFALAHTLLHLGKRVIIICGIYILLFIYIYIYILLFYIYGCVYYAVLLCIVLYIHRNVVLRCVDMLVYIHVHVAVHTHTYGIAVCIHCCTYTYVLLYRDMYVSVQTHTYGMAVYRCRCTYINIHCVFICCLKLSSNWS